MMLGIDWQSVVALLALAFSVYTFRRTHNLAQKQAELLEDQKRLNRILVEKEETEAANAKRADVSARMVRELKGSKVKVFNAGKASARNVRLVFDESSEGVRLLNREIFPLEILEPQQGVNLPAAVYLGSPAKTAITLIWDDGTGDNHEKVVYLTS